MDKNIKNFKRFNESEIINKETSALEILAKNLIGKYIELENEKHSYDGYFKITYVYISGDDIEISIEDEEGDHLDTITFGQDEKFSVK